MGDERDDGNGGKRRLGQRHQHRNENAPIAGTIDQGCLVQLTRQRTDELAQQEDVEGAAAKNIRYPERIERVDPTQFVEKDESSQKWVVVPRTTKVKSSTNVNSSQKGSDFEKWGDKELFEGGGKRLVVRAKDNQHLEKQDGLGITKERRISDSYYEKDNSIWEFKNGYEKTIVDLDQLEQFALMEEAGYVYTRDTSTGKTVKKPVKSVNYIYITA